MQVGDTVTVLWGAHAGTRGTIASLGATFVEIAVKDEEDPDWDNHVFVDLEQLQPEDPAASIANAVRGRRAHGWELRRFWIAEALRDPPRELATLADAYAAHAGPIERACETAVAAELARWETVTRGLDAAARDAKWQAEREQWTAWRDEGMARYRAILAELLPETPEDERRSRAEDLVTRARALEERVATHTARTKLGQPVAEEPRDAALERQIEADVDRDEVFLVYADWLQSQGNRRGEWIALSAARSPAAAQLRTELAPQLLGPLVDLEHRLATRWRLGYLDAITLATTRDDEDAGLDVVALLRVALALPTCRFLRELSIGLPSIHEHGSVIDTLVGAGPRPALRRLVLTANTEEEMLSWTTAGDLAPLAELYPNLESLEVSAGSYQLAVPDFPRLHRLVLQTCGAPRGIALAIARADWPLLEELELWFGSKSYGVELALDELRPLLEDAPLPRLRRLGLCNCEITDELCAVIVASPLLPRLERLSLANGTLTGVGADVLVANADRLRHLAELDVDENYLDPAELDRLRAAGVRIKTTWQRTADVWDGAVHRFASVGE